MKRLRRIDKRNFGRADSHSVFVIRTDRGHECGFQASKLAVFDNASGRKHIFQFLRDGAELFEADTPCQARQVMDSAPQIFNNEAGKVPSNFR